jgi:hypothetical protein
MPEVQEVFRMATQKVRPDPNALERQHRSQQRHVARQKAAVFVLVGALLIGGAVFGITTLQDDPGDTGTPGAGGATSTIPPLPGGAVEPGRYVFTSFDPGLDAAYEISIDVPDGYEDIGGWAVRKLGTSQTGVNTLAIGDVYADACRWEGTLLDRSAISSTDEVVAALATQKGLRVSTPTDVTVDGFAGTYMERRVPVRTDLSECDGGQFRVYLEPGGGDRYLVRGLLQRLWILDIEGVPLVIEAGNDPGTSALVRAELIQMAESIRIDPR